MNLGLATSRPLLTGESLHILGEQFTLLRRRLVTVLGIRDGFIFGTDKLLLLLDNTWLTGRSGRTTYLSIGSRGLRWSSGVTGIWLPTITSSSVPVEHVDTLCSSAVLADDPVTSRSTPQAVIMLSVSRTEPMNAWSRVFSEDSSMLNEPMLSLDIWCINRCVGTTPSQSCFM